MMPWVALAVVIASASFVVSMTTLWLTLLRPGRVRMTRPSVIYFGPDGAGRDLDSANEAYPKVYLRTLLYSIAKRGNLIENMFVRLRRGESQQTFSVWTYGEKDLSRGSGLFVGHEGIASNHHFLLQRDGSQFEFTPANYTLEVYATPVDRRSAQLLITVQLSVTTEDATALKSATQAGLYFDWGPDATRYHAHVRETPSTPSPEDMAMLLAGLSNLDPSQRLQEAAPGPR